MGIIPTFLWRSAAVTALLALTITPCALAQQVTFFSEVLIGTYSMKDFKEVQDNVVFLMLGNERIDIDHRIYHNFPAYPAVDIGLRFTFERFQLAFIYGKYSTGSRWYYRDYSGELVFDQLVEGHKLATEIQKFHFPLGNHIRLKPSLQLGYMFSTLYMDNSVEIYGYQALREEIEVRATQLFTLPSALFEYRVKSLLFTARLGYHLQLGSSDNKVDSSRERWESYSFHEEKKFKWSGFRAGLGVGLYLN